MPENSLSDQQIIELKRAVEKLKSKRPEERAAAQSALDALGANKFDVLIALLRKETADRRRRRRNVTIGMGVYVAFIIALIVVPLMLGDRPHLHFLNFTGGMTGVIGAAMAISAAQKNATEALSEFDDKRGVGWWALALEFPEKEMVALAHAKLVQLLPQLRASDRDLLDDEQRKALYRALGQQQRVARYDTALSLAILKALEQIGDDKALPFVEKLASGEGPAAVHPDLRIAAKDCLPALRERCELNRASQSLLRASASTEVPGLAEGLLRPASEAGNVTPDELLRATGAESGPAAAAQVARHTGHDGESGEPVVLRQGA